MSGAAIQFLLTILAVLLAILGWREDPQAGWYALGLVGSFATICTLLQWERWGFRYQIPLLVLESALIGVVLDRYFRRVAPLIGMGVIAAALPFALYNELRPLLPFRFSRQSPVVRWSDNSIFIRSRTDYYFADLRGDMEESYTAAAKAVRSQGCRNIDLDASLEDVSYLFLAVLNVNETKPALSYGGVYNLTRSLADPDRPTPCTVVCFACAGVRRKWAQYRSVGGRVSTFGDIAVFSSTGSLPNTERLSDDDDQIRMEAIAGEMASQFASVRELNSRPEYASILTDAESLDKRIGALPGMRVRAESITRTIGDASTIMLQTSRLRGEAADGSQLAPEERAALLAANEAVDNLEAEKVARLSELPNVEESVAAVTASAEYRRVAATNP